MNFIILLFICFRFNRKFEHIMIIVNKLFKKKKFISLDSLKIEMII